MLDKFIRMNGANSVGSQCLLGKIWQIERHDLLRTVRAISINRSRIDAG